MEKTMSERQVRVGVGTFVFRDGKFLVQKRQGAHGEGTWCLPGGHLEFGETPEETSHREVLEETGCKINNVRFAGVTNDIFYGEDKHYLTLWTMSDWADHEPQIMEPEKCTQQLWVDFDSIPEPHFLTWDQLLGGEFEARIRTKLAKTAKKEKANEI